MEYRVEWEQTWEDETNLSGCELLIRDYFVKDLKVYSSMPGDIGVVDVVHIKEEEVY